MTDLSRRLASLSPDEQAELDARLKARGLTEDRFPISVMQQGMWFFEQLRPNNPAYIVPAAVEIRGDLDIDVLRRAINEILRRHESLRTTFELRDGQPTQIVHPRCELDLPVIDLRDGRPGADELDDTIADAIGGSFDLTELPLVRTGLLRLGDEEWVLAVAMHHLVSDGWSVGVLLSELSALYKAFADGKPSPLPDLAVQYGDFAAWQQSTMHSGEYDDDIQYWTRHLAGAPAVLTLPADRMRPAVQRFDGGSVPFSLEADALDGLRSLGRHHQATPSMALLAAYAVLMHRYSGQDDVVIGVPTANRGRAELEPLIGFFVNTMPVRVDCSGRPDFREVLNRVREASLGLYSHQHVPFERVVEELRPPRDLSTPPVFQTCLSYQSDPVDSLTMADVELRRRPVKGTGARFDLELQVFDDDGGIYGWFEYDSALFEESTIDQLSRHLVRLVALAVESPDMPVDRLPLLDESERQRVLVDGNATDCSWPDAPLIHEAFERIARIEPDSPALRFEGTEVGYGELNRRANRLAHHLRGLGVGPDALVGVAMERSIDLVVGLMAVLKAGAAYVPLDPEYPAARLDFMVKDAEVEVLLAQPNVADALPPLDARILRSDELSTVLDGQPDTNPEVDVTDEDLAYVIYTSGSTGRPKGVMNVHGAIRSRLLWMQDQYELDGSDRVLQKTPISFDVSVWEFFWPLMVGATLVLARPGGHRDGGYLTDVIRREEITTVHFVPSMLQAFLLEPDVERCATLRRVICSGEALPRDLQDRLLARSGTELHNLYGPTEAAIDVTAWHCRPEDPHDSVPIGHPIANTRMYVLDRHGEPVPQGVAGELHIGGRNLARGYLRRPDLTAERFIPDPFRPDGVAGRLYRTGDLARYRSDGAIEYLGRLDRQIKLRGFRIELGEIETAIAAHDLVQQAVVTARDFRAGDVRLVAYVTGDESLRVEDLPTHLAGRLPVYMVPSAFVVLPTLPLTPNGKVDEHALPEPELERPSLKSAFVAPSDEWELDIAAIWTELLGVDRVGTDDNFFELGGHSLLMAELKVRLAALAGRDVTLVQLFQYPTVAAMAAHLDPARSQDADHGRGTKDRAARRTRARSGQRTRRTAARDQSNTTGR